MVASLVFRLVQRHVRVFEERCRILSILWIKRDADAAGDMEAMALNKKRIGDGLEYLFANRRHVVRLVNFPQHQYEFIAAMSGYGIAFPYAGAQPFRHVEEHPVSCGMTETVIDQFEVVEVEEQQCHTIITAVGLHHCLLQAILEQVAVGKSGECIMG